MKQIFRFHGVPIHTVNPRELLIRDTEGYPLDQHPG